MINVTIDTNFLIDFENQAASVDSLRVLCDAHRAGAIELRIPAISASEIQVEGRQITNFSEFVTLLKQLSLDDLKIVHPIGIHGLTFWGVALWGGDEMALLDRQIHEVLHPNIPVDYATHCKALGIPSDTVPIEKKWRNARCDALMLWCHIYHQGDWFVSRDKNFFKQSKKQRLIDLGAKRLMTPLEAATEISGNG